MDIKDFTDGKKEPKITSKRWWELSELEMASTITGIIQRLHKRQSGRRAQILTGARLYGNANFLGMTGMPVGQNQLSTRVTYNVVQSGIDTVTAKMAKNKPRPLFLTSGGDYKIQRRAKKLDKFIDGCFYENNAYSLGTDCFRDAGVFGDGMAHVFDYFDRVKIERVLSAELFVDDIEAFYGNPRQLHWVKNVDRDCLLELFPKKKSVIEGASHALADQLGQPQDVSDAITVRQSWHLPSGPDATDGLMVITIDDAVLSKQKWVKPYFPFAKMPWSKRLFGYWGQSAVEQIQNIQLELNKLLWVVSRSMHLAGTFKVWLHTSSKTAKEHINNDIGTIITGEVAPQYLTPPIVQPEIYQHIMTLKNQAFESLGVSQLSAASQKPAGLDSGRALREFNDIETDRFRVIGQAYEQFYIDMARLVIDCAKGIYEKTGKYEVKVPGRGFIDTIDWKDVDLEEDEYVMKAYPVSQLPNTPEGRLQTVTEYMQAGIVSPRTGRKLLDFPDLEMQEDLANAQEEYLNEILEKIIDDGEFTPPEPQDDLDLAQELVLQYYAQGKTNNLEEEKLDLLRRFNDQVSILKQKALPPPPMPIPQAAPMPQPQSEMVPNVPGMPIQ